MNEPKLVEANCFSCGKPVMIVVPFYGCVYCSDCIKSESTINYSATTEDFKRGIKS